MGQAHAQQAVLGLVGGRLALAARRRPQGGGILAEVQRHPARVATQGARTDPYQLAARAQRVQPRRRVRAQAAREHVALPDLDGERQRLKRHQRLAQAVDPGAGGGVAIDALPGGQGGGEGALIGRLDLAAQGGQRGAP